MEDAGPMAGIIFFVLLLLDIFFYGFDAAVSNLNEKELDRRAGEEKEVKSRHLLQIISDPDRYVNTLQLATSLIHVIAGAVYLTLWEGFFERVFRGLAEEKMLSLSVPGGILALAFSALAGVLSALALLYIFLTFGVLMSKRLAARSPERWAYACVGPVWALMKLFAPFTGLVSATAKGILFLLGVRSDGSENDVTEEEIINMVQEGFEQGVIEDSEAEMISNIFAYGDKEAQDIMTNRSNVVAIDGNMHLKDAVDFMLAGTNSRYPVYEENIDHIIGILHLKDAMRYHRRDASVDGCIKDLDGLLREAYFVPQTKNIDELFEEMQSRKLQMVIVVDEYGQTDGLVAMEDILEEIVGDILDEYDDEEILIVKQSDDSYILKGTMLLEDIEDMFDIVFECENIDTINGFLIDKMGRIPQENEDFQCIYKGYNFKVVEVDNRMITKVSMTYVGIEENTQEER